MVVYFKNGPFDNLSTLSGVGPRCPGLLGEFGVENDDAFFLVVGSILCKTLCTHIPGTCVAGRRDCLDVGSLSLENRSGCGGVSELSAKPPKTGTSGTSAFHANNSSRRHGGGPPQDGGCRPDSGDGQAGERTGGRHHPRAGQTCVVLDDREIQAQLRENEAAAVGAEADLDVRTRDLTRYRNLLKDGAVTQEFDHAQGQYRSAKAQIKRMKTVPRSGHVDTHRNRRVRAPSSANQSSTRAIWRRRERRC